MAIVTTTMVPRLSNFPWADTAAADPADKTIRPIGELEAVVLDGVIAAPGVGDNANVTQAITLPDNFNYILMDASVTVQGVGLAAASNWELQGGMVIFGLAGPGPSPQKEFGVGMSGPGAWQVGTNWIQAWRPDDPLPTYLLGPGTIITANFVNLTNNDIAGVYNSTFRFLMYTIDQRYDAGVNTPLLIR